MTVKTQFLSRCHQEIPVFTGMSIVAVRTESISNHLMNADCLVREQIVVALLADEIRFCMKEGAVFGSVRVVAL
jgi:hypothetical protein